MFILMTALLIQEDKTILTLYAPNNTASKCTKRNLTELKGRRGESTRRAANLFNSRLSVTEQRNTTTKKINDQEGPSTPMSKLHSFDVPRTQLQDTYSERKGGTFTRKMRCWAGKQVPRTSRLWSPTACLLQPAATPESTTK